MGLTIHYSLKYGGNLRDARDVVRRMQSRARDLPFAKVGPVVEISGDECDYERRPQKDPRRWLLVQAGHYLDLPVKKGIHYRVHVSPTHLIAFDTLPGEGSEQANFGLCKYPATIEASDSRRPGQTTKLRTGLSGWRWGSFCKTQYASAPQYGGVKNFLRCHLSVVRLLDFAKELGILEDVNDEGDYWETRDMEALGRTVGEWNHLIAAFAGRLKDALGDNVVAPITKFTDFEHLEAKGRDSEIGRERGE